MIGVSVRLPQRIGCIVSELIAPGQIRPIQRSSRFTPPRPAPHLVRRRDKRRASIVRHFFTLATQFPLGSFASWRSVADFRSSPMSGHRQTGPECLKRARSGIDTWTSSEPDEASRTYQVKGTLAMRSDKAAWMRLAMHNSLQIIVPTLIHLLHRSLSFR